MIYNTLTSYRQRWSHQLCQYTALWEKQLHIEHYRYPSPFVSFQHLAQVDQSQTKLSTRACKRRFTSATRAWLSIPSSFPQLWVKNTSVFFCRELNKSLLEIVFSPWKRSLNSFSVYKLPHICFTWLIVKTSEPTKNNKWDTN